MIGCSCAVCRSLLPHNQRFRTSALVTLNGKKILIDAGPDFRSQALHFHINRLDGVIFTHSHNDHIAGVDDLRVYYAIEEKALPCLLSLSTLEDLQTRYPYIFSLLEKSKRENPKKLLPQFDLRLLQSSSGEVDFLGSRIQYLTYEQTGMLVNGYRFGKLAYITDIRHYSKEIFSELEGVEFLILSGLRFTSSTMHFTVDEAIAFAEQVKAKQTWLTHISHELDHEKTNAYLPESIRMAYDGLEIFF